ncbi:hypothetical protein ScPMuIL_006158 [Solemya velum]
MRFTEMDKKQTKVQVVVRVRPPLDPVDTICANALSHSVEIFNHRNIKETIKYDFAAVYNSESTQQMIYNDAVKPLLLQSIQGQNISIFAYGPTGAGKTHTMLGSPSDPGIITRVINGLFQSIEADSRLQSTQEWNYSVSFSYLEIYNEKVHDLLEPKNSDLPIREDGDKNIFVPGLTDKTINNFDEFKALFVPASNNRTTAATKLNDRSSRSHSILLLKVKKTGLRPPHREFHGKIYLIDLAGSEDNRRTGNKGIRLKESGAINKSLFVLGEVVDAINNGLPRIPYRNSKLTRLLQDSIGGSCHSVMITNIAPEQKYYYDTYCTLNFASKSKKIVNNTCTKETSRLQGLKRSVSESHKEISTVSQPKKARSCFPADTRDQSLPNGEAHIPQEPPKMMDPAPYLSPLLRRQNFLEETVNRRFEELEHNILEQMRHMVQKPDVSSPLENDTLADIKKTLESSKQQLQLLAQQQQQVCSKKEDHSNNRTPFTDKTNVHKESQRKSVEKDMIPTTPLFFNLPKVFKRGFKSTAAKSKTNDDDLTKTPKSKSRKIQSPFNPELQKKHNEEILVKMNTASVKELQTLQTVGLKRANLISEWREVYGPFSNFDDLKKIPGFTEKYLQNLLRSNLVCVL